MPPTSVAAITIVAAVKRPNVLLVILSSENLSTALLFPWGSRVDSNTPRARADNTSPAPKRFTRQIARNEPKKVTRVSRPRAACAPPRVLYCCAGRGPEACEGTAARASAYNSRPGDSERVLLTDAFSSLHRHPRLQRVGAHR